MSDVFFSDDVGCLSPYPRPNTTQKACLLYLLCLPADLCSILKSSRLSKPLLRCGFRSTRAPKIILQVRHLLRHPPALAVRLADGIGSAVFFVFFYEVGTALWPREFYHFVSKANSRGKIPVAIPRFLLPKKKKHRHSIRRGLLLCMVLWPLFIPHFGIFVMVNSPRFPRN